MNNLTTIGHFEEREFMNVEDTLDTLQANVSNAEYEFVADLEGDGSGNLKMNMQMIRAFIKLVLEGGL